MKSLWNNFKVAFAMFSKIPMPRADWTKENMKYMFCFFPFIGTVIGILTMAVTWLGLRFGYEPGFVTVVLVLIPVGSMWMDFWIPLMPSAPGRNGAGDWKS